MVSTIALLAVLGFSATAFANIYPDQDPCQPVPPLDGEYQGEYNTRLDVDNKRCACRFPGPAPSEQFDEFNERNRIDRGRCTGNIIIQPWSPPPVIVDLGPVVGAPWVGGGYSWRDSGHWHEPRWTRGRGRPEPVRGRPEPVRGRPEPVRGRPEPVRGRPEPVRGRPEPVRGRPEPVRGRPEPVRGGRGGRP